MRSGCSADVMAATKVRRSLDAIPQLPHPQSRRSGVLPVEAVEHLRVCLGSVWASQLSTLQSALQPRFTAATGGHGERRGQQADWQPQWHPELVRPQPHPGGAHRLTRKRLVSTSVTRSLQHNDGTAPPKAVSEADRKFFFDAMAAVTADPVKRLRAIAAEVASNPQASLSDEDLDARVALFGASRVAGFMQPCAWRVLLRKAKRSKRSDTLLTPSSCVSPEPHRGAA